MFKLFYSQRIFSRKYIEFNKKYKTLFWFKNLQPSREIIFFLSFHGSTALLGPGLLLVEVLRMTHTHTHTHTHDRTALEQGSASSRDLYLTTHNTHKRQTSMPAAGFESANLARERAAGPHLRPRGHWDCQDSNSNNKNNLKVLKL